MESAMDTELGGLFEFFHKASSMRTDLSEMGHLQPPTLIGTENTATNSIVNGTGKRKRSLEIDMRLYWVKYRIRQNLFHILWEEVKKNLSEYVTKNHPIWHHRAMRPRFVKATKKDIENSKERQPGRRRGCAGNTNPRGTWKPDNLLKGIQNTIPQDLDNSLKVIQDLVKSVTWSQWTGGLTITTWG